MPYYSFGGEPLASLYLKVDARISSIAIASTNWAPVQHPCIYSAAELTVEVHLLYSIGCKHVMQNQKQESLKSIGLPGHHER